LLRKPLFGLQKRRIPGTLCETHTQIYKMAASMPPKDKEKGL